MAGDTFKHLIVHRSDSITSLDPDTIPSTLRGPLVWSGGDLVDQDSYIYQLSLGDIDEIISALQYFKTLGLDGHKVSRDNFPLPNFGSQLLDCAATIHQGRGFAILRGLDASKHTIEDSATIFLGISNYIANQRGLQDRKGNVLSHIIDSKLWTVPVDQRHGIHSRQALPYHNDMGCDTLALQVRQGANRGGYTYVSSTWTAFNQLIEEDPSAAKTLLTPDWPVQISGRDARYYLAPVLAIHQGKLMASLDPNRFGPHPRSQSTDIPNLTDSQQRALDKLLNMARNNELRLNLKTGDILFLNNWSLLHRRDSYIDDEDTSRHLVRLWIRNTELGWAVPSGFMPPWLAAYGDEAQTKMGLYSLVPMPEYKTPKYSAGSAAFTIEDSDFDCSDAE